MMGTKFTYREEFWQLTHGLPGVIRLEAQDGIIVYALYGQVLEMSADARAVFQVAKKYIDAERTKNARISEARAKAGRANKGKPKTNVSKSLKASKLETNVSENEGTKQLISNVCNSLKTNQLETNDNKCFQPPLNNNNISPYINIYSPSSTTGAGASAYARMMEWLSDNETSLQILCIRNGLIKQPEPKDVMLGMLAPYAQAFIEAEAVREAIERNDRRDVKTWFERWLPKFKQLKDNEIQENKRGDGGPGQGTPSADDYFQI